MFFPRFQKRAPNHQPRTRFALSVFWALIISAGAIFHSSANAASSTSLFDDRKSFARNNLSDINLHQLSDYEHLCLHAHPPSHHLHLTVGPLCRWARDVDCGFAKKALFKSISITVCRTRHWYVHWTKSWPIQFRPINSKSKRFEEGCQSKMLQTKEKQTRCNKMGFFKWLAHFGWQPSTLDIVCTFCFSFVPFLLFPHSSWSFRSDRIECRFTQVYCVRFVKFVCVFFHPQMCTINEQKRSNAGPDIIDSNWQKKASKMKMKKKLATGKIVWLCDCRNQRQQTSVGHFECEMCAHCSP